MALHKSWQWVGAFGPDVMLCVAHARVGVLRRSWWAVWDGRGCTRAGARRSRSSLERGTPIEVTTGPAWTRKTPLRVTGTVLGPRDRPARDCSTSPPGRHARRTAWRWSAGAGVAASGAAVVWNLVEGLHDGSPSERTVWVDGEPHEVGPQPFDGLARVGDLDVRRARRRGQSARTTS